MTDLGTLGGRHSNVIGLNDSGQAVGWAEIASSHDHAFMTGPNGVGMTDLGTLGGNESIARGVSDSAQVVGNAQAAKMVILTLL